MCLCKVMKDLKVWISVQPASIRRGRVGVLISQQKHVEKVDRSSDGLERRTHTVITDKVWASSSQPKRMKTPKWINKRRNDRFMSESLVRQWCSTGMKPVGVSIARAVPQNHRFGLQFHSNLYRRKNVNLYVCVSVLNEKTTSIKA